MELFDAIQNTFLIVFSGFLMGLARVIYQHKFRRDNI